MSLNKAINKDLILRERLALQRTILANQSTFLSFLRTSLYFLIAGLSIRNLLQVKNGYSIEIILFGLSLFILIFGVTNYLKHKKSIRENKKHIGDYQLDYFTNNEEKF
jgi:putative membrane protein